MANGHEPHITATKTPGGWKLEMDNAAWVQLMSALSIAINSEVRDGDLSHQAGTFRKLRTALSRAERIEG
jgi:hypothetical protein